MAKAAFNLPFNHPFSTRLGDYSVYTRRDSKKLVVRSKGGASKEKIKKDAAFKKTRLQNMEFGGCSKAAKMLRGAMKSVAHVADMNLHAQLTGLIMAIREMDTNEMGRRSIIFSRGRHLVEGFNLNKETSFDSVITSPVTYSIDRATHTSVIQLPPISPGRNFNSAWTYPFYRFRINLGVIRDMIYVDKVGYKKILNDVNDYTEILDTDWYQWKDKVIGQELGLKIVDPAFDNNCHLLLTIGIEFGTPSGGKIKTVKHAGCAKVLGMV